MLSNRDEYLKRPTSFAKFWDPPNSHILAPFDLARDEHGTWIGISKKGRIAVLLNLHEKPGTNPAGQISRGLFTKEFLMSDLDTDDWIEQENSIHGKEELAKAGGFTIFCGILRKRKDYDDATEDTPVIEPFRLLSNRVKTEGLKVFDQPSQLQSNLEVDISIESDNFMVKPDYTSINGRTIGISNTPVTDPWPKVRLGISHLNSVIVDAVEKKSSESELISELIKVLNTDTYPKAAKDSDALEAFENLKYSVFIPTLAINKPPTKPLEKQEANTSACAASQHNNSGPGIHYGTRTNTIILVSKTGHVKYIERSLHTKDTIVEEGGVQESVFEFDIEGF